MTVNLDGLDMSKICDALGCDNAPEPSSKRRHGRPRAIPEALVPKVLLMYHRQGLGYRAVARELLADGLCVDWSTVRRVVKAHRTDTPGQRCPLGDL
jgi:hypothetical protein